MKKVNLLALSISMLAVASASAGDLGWKGNTELGFVSTSGNTETETLNAKVKVGKETQGWKHEGTLAALGTSDNDGTTAERYSAGFKSDKKINDRSYWYGLLAYDDDRFSSFDYQASAGVGYGYKVIKSEGMNLDFEVGPGYRLNAFDEVRAADGSLITDNYEEEEATLRVGEKFDWQFSDSAKLEQYLVALGGDKNVTTTAGLFVTSALAESLSLKVGAEYKHDKVVSAGFDSVDTVTSATVVYSF